MNRLEVGQYYRIGIANADISVMNRNGPDRSHCWVRLVRDSIILLLGYDGKGYMEYIYDGEFIRSWAHDLEVYCHMLPNMILQ